MANSDKMGRLTKKQKEFLSESWAEVFSTKIFPHIDEGRFAVLYDGEEKVEAPISVMVGSLIIKELLNLSDAEVVNSLKCDFRFQYALHTLDLAEQPLSTDTLHSFRKHCFDYKESTGKDLMRDSVLAVCSWIYRLMRDSDELKIFDPMDIPARIDKFAMSETLYLLIADLSFSFYREDNDYESMPYELLHYEKPEILENDFVKTFFYLRTGDLDVELNELLSDSDKLYKLCNHENFDDEVLSRYTEFISKHFQRYEIDFAAANNTRRKNLEENKYEYRNIVDCFEFTEYGERVIRCPAGFRPRLCTNDNNFDYELSFAREQCENCARKELCDPKLNQKSAKVKICIYPVFEDEGYDD